MADDTAGVMADDAAFIAREHVPAQEPVPPGTRRAAVLGSPIAHSLSPAMHRAAYASLGLTAHRYDRFEVDEASVAAFVEGLDDSWCGLSLTMPLKRAVIPLLDEISPLARAVGSVNTVVFAHSDGERRVLRGDNTDVQGIIGALAEQGVAAVGASSGSAVVIGGGATAASAVAALGRLGWRRVRLCVRSRERAAEMVEIGARLDVLVELAGLDAAAPSAAEADVVIATVPGSGLDSLAAQVRVGRRADGAAPVLLDVVYDPWPTALARAWQQGGGVVASGKDMLVHQAVDQVAQMTGLIPDVEVLRAAIA